MRRWDRRWAVPVGAALVGTLLGAFLGLLAWVARTPGLVGSVALWAGVGLGSASLFALLVLPFWWPGFDD